LQAIDDYHHEQALDRVARVAVGANTTAGSGSSRPSATTPAAGSLRRGWRERTDPAAVGEETASTPAERSTPPALTSAKSALTLADATQLTDNADAGIALFLTDQPAEPATVDIYDANGRLLATHAGF